MANVRMLYVSFKVNSLFLHSFALPVQLMKSTRGEYSIRLTVRNEIAKVDSTLNLAFIMEDVHTTETNKNRYIISKNQSTYVVVIVIEKYTELLGMMYVL
jgi:hypothetical protein